MPATNLRFSASYAERYHNCHASANLEEAIPGFENKKKEYAAARDQGTMLHKVLENIVNEVQDLRAAEWLFKELAEVSDRGKVKQRSTIITDEKAYIVWWFMLANIPPVIEHRFIRPLVFTSVKVGEETVVSTPPKLLRFLAEAIGYLATIVEQDPEHTTIRVEVTATANWMSTGPRTTVDIIIEQNDDLYIIDLKTGTIEVKADGNAQLLYYAKTFRKKNQTRLHLIILQDGYTAEWLVMPEFLDAWAVEVQASEQAILDGDLSFNAGEHCKMCPANPRSNGDRGYPFCPTMIEIMYGPADDRHDDETILED